MNSNFVFKLLLLGVGVFVFLHLCEPVYATKNVTLNENRTPNIKKFTVFKLSLKAKNPGENPYVDGPEVSAIFTGPKNISIMVKGFWDGDNVFSIRFSPHIAGIWNYTTISSDPGLNNMTGTFKAVTPSKKELESNILYNGFLKTDGYGWKIGEDKSFLPIGETQWSFTEEFHTSEWQEWIKTLRSRKYNSFLGCIWLGLYNRAGISPFKGNPKDDQLNEAFFDRLDEWVEYANQHGILMGLTIGGFPDNSKWFTMFNTKERNDRWFQYCVRRYAAFNVRWVLYGEIDEVNPPWSTWENNAEAMAQLIKDEDPYNHPVGSHHQYIDRATARSSNIDYLCIQSNRNAFGRMDADYQYLTTKDYRQYGKPLWFEEYWYENAEGLNPGLRNTYRNFIAGMAFPTMGSLMREHEKDNGFPPRIAENKKQSLFDFLMETDSGMLCMQYFADFFDNINFNDFAPAPEKIKVSDLTHLCGRFGDEYIVFKQHGGEVYLDLTDASGIFNVEMMEIVSGKRKKMHDISSGDWRIIDSRDTIDVVFRISGGLLPKYPVVCSPIEEAKFMPGEKVYLKVEGEPSYLRIELSGEQKTLVLPLDPSMSSFVIPLDVKDYKTIKISGQNEWGNFEQIHRITSNRKNNPPIISSQNVEVYSGKSINIQLGYSDTDGPGPYDLKIVKVPENGELLGSGNDRIYKSNPQFEGIDQFIWSINDGIDDAEKAATVRIHVKRKSAGNK